MSSSPSRKRQKWGTDDAPASTASASLAGSNQSTNVQAKDPSTAATSSDEGAPTLPPAVWGHVLDYLLYGEVRQAILVNKTMANEASKYVEEIYITDESSQLDVVAARRFPNVEYVQIQCLVRWNDKETCELVEDTTKRAVPFLSVFANLEEFYLGGNDTPDPEHSDQFYGYSPQHCRHPVTHKELMRVTMKSLCNAFRTRALSQDVVVRGLMGDYGRTHACKPAEAVEGRPCEMCREILLTSPPL